MDQMTTVLHAVAIAILSWQALSAVINILLTLRTPEQWVTWAEKNPELALVLNVLVKDFGMDPVSMIRRIQAYVAQRAQLKTKNGGQP